jgi:hypothetical protein
MEIEGKPFLVTGNFGSGKTAAFTGFTPVAGFGAHWTEDERLSANPSTRALFLTAATLLSEVSSRQPSSPELLLEQRIKPLFETLKSQSTTSVSLSLIPAEAKPNRDNFETRFPVRVRNQGSYAHGVHLYLQWNKSGAPYFADLSDNDFDLLPGEERVITIWTRSENNHPAINGTLHVSGPNISPSEVPVAVAVRTDN